MALKPFNTVGGLSVGPNVSNVLVDTNGGDGNVANYTINTTGYGNITLGLVSNIHVAGGNANAAVLGAVAIGGSGNVTGITITSGGDGYTQAPDVVISGANTQTAHVTALIDGNGTVTGFAITDPGAGYSSATAAISSPTPRYLQTNGGGVLSWKEVPASTVAVAGDDTEVQYNNGGALGASNAFTFSNSTSTLSTRNLVVSNGAATITSNNGSTIRGVTIQGSTDSAFTANYTITLPTANGANYQFLQTDSNGVTTWADAFKLVNGNSNVFVDANANIRISANGNADIVTINGTGNANTQGITVNGIVNALAFANGNSNVSVSANSNVVTSANGNVVVTVTSSGDGNRQTTGAVVDGYITANGNINASNFVGPLANGNSSVAITANANVVTTANGNAVVTVTSSGDGNLETTGANIAGYLSVTGAITGVFANGTSNVAIPAANGNVNISAAGNANIAVITGTGANFTGYVTATGNVTAPNFVGVLANGNSTVAITSNANVVTTANGNVVVTVTSSGDGNLTTTGGNVAGYWSATSNIIAPNFNGVLSNGTSNVAIPAANGNVIVSANGQANIVIISSNGTISTTTLADDLVVGGNLTVNGNTTYVNVETFTVEDPVIILGSGANGAVPPENANDLGILLRANTAGEGAVDRFMGWDTSNSEFSFGSSVTDSTNVITFNTLANVRAGNFIGTLANGTSNVRIAANDNIAVSANGNANIFTITSSGDGNLLTTGAETTGYFTAGNNITALANVQSNNNVILEGTVEFADDYTNTATYFSNIGAATLTTSDTTSDQAIVKVPYALGRVVEYLVKSADTVGDIYQAQSITAIISAANTIDYTNWGIVGNSAGAISVALTDSNANITLQVTPASSNSSVFTAQYRVL